MPDAREKAGIAAVMMEQKPLSHLSMSTKGKPRAKHPQNARGTFKHLLYTDGEVRGAGARLCGISLLKSSSRCRDFYSLPPADCDSDCLSELGLLHVKLVIV